MGGGTGFPRALPRAGMCCPFRAAGHHGMRRYRGPPAGRPVPARTDTRPPTNPTAHSP
jgi:hypothetical protein